MTYKATWQTSVWKNRNIGKVQVLTTPNETGLHLEQLGLYKNERKVQTCNMAQNVTFVSSQWAQHEAFNQSKIKNIFFVNNRNN